MKISLLLTLDGMNPVVYSISVPCVLPQLHPQRLSAF